MNNRILLLMTLILFLRTAKGVQIAAVDVLRQIENGDHINYNNVTIVGDLDFSMLNLIDEQEGYDTQYINKNLKNIDSKIQITNSRIEGDIIFSEMTLLESVDFGNTRFIGHVYFLKTMFNGYSSFKNARFDGDAYFDSANFCKNANFVNATFDGYANFRSAVFNNRANFDKVTFRESVDFQDAEFLKKCSNDDTHFDKDLYLGGATIHKMQLDNAKFDPKSEISLNDSDFDRLFVRWGDISDHLVYNDAAYLALINNFKQIGDFGDADDCYYQYRQKKQAKKGWLDESKYIDILAWISCGYGVRPFHTILSSILSVLFFGFIFWLGDGIQKSAESPKSRKNEPIYTKDICMIFYMIIKNEISKYINRLCNLLLKNDREQFNTTFFDAVYFSLLVFTFQSRGEWHPSGGYKYLALIVGILGILLIGLFVVTLGNTMIR